MPGFFCMRNTFPLEWSHGAKHADIDSSFMLITKKTVFIDVICFRLIAMMVLHGNLMSVKGVTVGESGRGRCALLS